MRCLPPSAPDQSDDCRALQHPTYYDFSQEGGRLALLPGRKTTLTYFLELKLRQEGGRLALLSGRKTTLITYFHLCILALTSAEAAMPAVAPRCGAYAPTRRSFGFDDDLSPSGGIT